MPTRLHAPPAPAPDLTGARVIETYQIEALRERISGLCLEIAAYSPAAIEADATGLMARRTGLMARRMKAATKALKACVAARDALTVLDLVPRPVRRTPPIQPRAHGSRWIGEGAE